MYGILIIYGDEGRKNAWKNEETEYPRYYRKEYIEYKLCVLFFSTTVVWNIFCSGKYLASYAQNIQGICVCRSSCKEVVTIVQSKYKLKWFDSFL